MELSLDSAHVQVVIVGGLLVADAPEFDLQTKGVVMIAIVMVFTVLPFLVEMMPHGLPQSSCSDPAERTQPSLEMVLTGKPTYRYCSSILTIV